MSQNAPFCGIFMQVHMKHLSMFICLNSIVWQYLARISEWKRCFPTSIAIFLKIFDHQIHKLSIVCGESTLIIIRLNMIYIGFLIKTLKCLFFNWNTLEHGLKMVSRWRSINLVLNEATVVGLWKFPKNTSPTTTKPGSDVEQRVHFLVPMRWSPTWCSSGRSCPISNSIWALELVCHTYEMSLMTYYIRCGYFTTIIRNVITFCYCRKFHSYRSVYGWYKESCSSVSTNLTGPAHNYSVNCWLVDFDICI